MKQKYVLAKSGEKETLTISEYTEVEKNTFSLICEESHDGEAIRAAIEEGTEKLISTFRTHNMYPRVKYAEQMAGGIVELFSTRESETKEFVFDDKDAFSRTATSGMAFQHAIERDPISADALIVDDDDDAIGDVDDDELFDETEPDPAEDEE